MGKNKEVKCVVGQIIERNWLPKNEGIQTSIENGNKIRCLGDVNKNHWNMMMMMIIKKRKTYLPRLAS